MTSRTAVCLFALALVATPAIAQPNLLEFSISPNPAPVGATITVAARDLTTMNLHSPGGSLIGGVYDAPNGNLLAAFPGILLPQPIPTCASGAAPRTQTWDQMTMAGPATPGTYWFGIAVSPGPFGPISNEWFCVTIENSMNQGPALSEVAPAQLGMPYVMQLDNAEPFAPYVTALSQTTNVAPFLSAGVCLDDDFLFNLSLMPFPLFINFQGMTDMMGSASGITIDLTNAPPILACFTAHVQIVVFETGGPALSNDHQFTIQ